MATGGILALAPHVIKLVLLAQAVDPLDAHLVNFL